MESQKNEKWPEYEEWPEGLSEQIKEKGIFFQIIRVLLGLGVIASLFNSELINIILIEKLGGLNGLSFPVINFRPSA